MKKVNSTLEDRLNRILTSVMLEKPDRVPVVLEYDTFAAQVTNTPFPEFLLSIQKSVEVMIHAYKLVAEKGAADAINYGESSPFSLSEIWLSKVSVPGLDLPENISFQVVEKEIMNTGDYDRILNKGWPDFKRDLLATRIQNDVPEKYLPINQPPVDTVKEWADIDVPVLNGGVLGPPFEYLCGGRSLSQFFMDLATIPDKIEAVMDHMTPYLVDSVCRRAKKMGYPAVWVGGWRGAPAMLSPGMWDRFFWTYFRKLVHEVVDCGLIPILHLDSCWDRELSRFRELPKGKAIMALDGATDIFKAKEFLGDHICIMGDVPANKLFLADPEEIYEYCSKLIRELGPEGFILQSGCDIPENAKLENVQAMVSAAKDS